MNAETRKLYGKRALSLLLFAAGIVVIYLLLRYPLVDDTKAQSRVTFHDYYETDPIDILFVGPSHSVHFIDAVLMTDTLGRSVYNLATTGQLLVETNALIHDAIDNRGIKKIFCEVSVSRLPRTESEPTAIYIVTDYLKNPWYNAKMIFGETPTDAYLNGLKLRRGMEPLQFYFSKPVQIMKKKQDPDYKNYKGTKSYRGRGQWGIYSINYDQAGYAFNVKTGGINHTKLEDVQDKQMEYLLDIIRYCKEKDVELVLYIPPYSEVYKQVFEQYWEITDMVKDTVAREGATIIDLNLVKDEYLKLDANDFYVHDHANSQAGEEISAFLAQYIKDPEGDYFLDTIEEKYPDQDSVTAVAFEAQFVTDQGSYSKYKLKKGDLKDVKVTLWAQGYHQIPATARMWSTTYDEETDTYTEGEELTGKTIDAYKTEFSFPGEQFKTNFLIRLYDPETGEQIYQANTKFDKD